MATEQELHEVEITLAQANANIERMNNLTKLINSKEFDEVITKGYFEQEAIRLVLSKGDPSMQTPELQKAIIEAIDGIGRLRQYFTTIMHTGAMAQKAKAETEAVRDDLLNEAS